MAVLGGVLRSMPLPPNTATMLSFYTFWLPLKTMAGRGLSAPKEFFPEDSQKSRRKLGISTQKEICKRRSKSEAVDVAVEKCGTLTESHLERDGRRGQ